MNKLKQLATPNATGTCYSGDMMKKEISTLNAKTQLHTPNNSAEISRLQRESLAFAPMQTKVTGIAPGYTIKSNNLSGVAATRTGKKIIGIEGGTVDGNIFSPKRIFQDARGDNSTVGNNHSPKRTFQDTQEENSINPNNEQLMKDLVKALTSEPLNHNETGTFKYIIEGYELDIQIKSSDIKKKRIDVSQESTYQYMQHSQSSPHYMGQTIMRTKVPKAILANEVKSYFLDLLVQFNVPLGGTNKKQLPWTTLTKILSDHDLKLVNWPEDVPYPGSKYDTSDDNKGIKGMRLDMLMKLHAAIKHKTNPIQIKRINNITLHHDVDYEWNYHAGTKVGQGLSMPYGFNGLQSIDSSYHIYDNGFNGGAPI